MVHIAELKHTAVLKKGEKYIDVPHTCGPSWWKIFHNTAEAIRSDGCPHCGEESVSLMNYMHDLINVKLDKKPIKPTDDKRWFPMAQKLHDSISLHQTKSTGRKCPLDSITAKETPSDMKKHLAIMSKSIHKKDYGQFVKEVNSLCNTKQLRFSQEKDTEVKISGKCKVPGEGCEYKVYGGGKTVQKTPKVETKVSSVGEIKKAVDQVRSELAPVEIIVDPDVKHRVPSTFDKTFAIGQNDTTKYEFTWKIKFLYDFSQPKDEQGVTGLEGTGKAYKDLCKYQEIQTSQLFPNLTPNPCYPQELQPRDRERTASKLQILNMAKELDATSLLTDFHSLDKGAPIVNKDGFVLSGNGRVLAIMRSANSRDFHEKSGANIFSQYQEYLNEMGIRGAGGTFGAEIQKETSVISATHMMEDDEIRIPLVNEDQPAVYRTERSRGPSDFKNPIGFPIVYVLVRELDTSNWTDEQLLNFVQEANSSGTLAQSSIENAVNDARRLSPSEFRILAERGESQDKSLSELLKTAPGRLMLTQFFGELPPFEQAKYFTADGELNQDGVKRVEMAIYVYVFGEKNGSDIAELKFETLDQFIQLVFRALDKSIFRLALIRSKIEQKAISDELDIAVDLSQAIMVYVAIKKTPGQTVDLFLNQESFLERQLTPFQESLLKEIDKNSRKPRVLSAIWNAWSERILQTPDPGQISMITGPSLLTNESLYREALEIAEVQVEKEPVMALMNFGRFKARQFLGSIA